MILVEEKQNIPKGWQRVKLGDILLFEKGRLPKTLVDKQPSDDYLPYLTIKTISGCIPQYADKKSGVIAEEDDLLVIADGSRSGFLFTGRKGLVSSTFLRIRGKEVVANPYLYNLFHHLDFTDGKFRKGGAIPHFDYRQLDNLVILLPPLPEQKKITEILSTVDTEIQKTDEIIVATEKLKRGLMQRLFTRGIDSVNFKKLSLDKMLDLIIDHRGLTPKKLGGEWAENGIPAISAMNIKGGEVIKLEAIRFVSDALFKKWMPEGIQGDDVVLTSEAPLGEVYLVKSEDKYCLSQRLFALRSDKKVVIGGYLYYFLMSQIGQSRLLERATGSTAKGIRQAELRKVIVDFPKDINEQKKIVSTLTSVDEKISINKKLKEKLTRLKKGLMQDLLSGKVRIKI